MARAACSETVNHVIGVTGHQIQRCTRASSLAAVSSAWEFLVSKSEVLDVEMTRINFYFLLLLVAAALLVYSTSWHLLLNVM